MQLHWVEKKLLQAGYSIAGFLSPSSEASSTCHYQRLHSVPKGGGGRHPVPVHKAHLHSCDGLGHVPQPPLVCEEVIVHIHSYAQYTLTTTYGMQTALAGRRSQHAAVVHSDPSEHVLLEACLIMHL